MRTPLRTLEIKPQAGNAGPLTFHRLRDLAPGTYWWAVQSVTPSWQASAFSEEDTFTIPPRILSLTERPGGELRLLVEGRSHGRVIVEESDNLATWRRATLIEVNENGLGEWVFPASSETRFFRLK